MNRFACVSPISPFFVRTGIHMNFRTRTTWTGIAHFPEIVFFIPQQNAVFGNPFFPFIIGFVIARQACEREIRIVEGA